MSALVNLAKFREEKLADYVEGQRAAEELQQRIWELDDQKKALVRSPPSGLSEKNSLVRSPPSGYTGGEVSGALSSFWSITRSLWYALLFWSLQQRTEMPFTQATKALDACHSSGCRAYVCLGSAAQRQCWLRWAL